MIRQTLKSGLLATIAVLAFLPTAAGAAPADNATPHPVPAAISQYHAHRIHHIHHAPYRLHRHHQYRTYGRVTTGYARLNVRSGPGTGYRVIGHRHAGQYLHLTCRTRGSWVHGNRTWYRLAHHRGYVTAHYVRTRRALPWC